jgi:hypothetical protein
MNIFKALFSGWRYYGEEHASSFLGYLLNPHSDHGLGLTFLRAFIDALDKAHGGKTLQLPCKIDKIGYQEDYRSPTVDVILEKSLENSNRGRADILVLIKDNNAESSNEYDHALLIENKIYDCSIGNVSEQLNQYKKCLFDVDNTFFKGQVGTIHRICILPKFEDIASQQKTDDGILWLAWKDRNENPHPQVISSIFHKILEDSNTGKIAPLLHETRFVILSYLNFMKDDYRGYRYSPPVTPLTEEEKADYKKVGERILPFVTGVKKRLQDLGGFSDEGLGQSKPSYAYGVYLWLLGDSGEKIACALLGFRKDKEDWGGDRPSLCLRISGKPEYEIALAAITKLRQNPQAGIPSHLEPHPGSDGGVLFRLGLPDCVSSGSDLDKCIDRTVAQLKEIKASICQNIK